MGKLRTVETARFAGNEVEDSGELGGETRELGCFAWSSIWYSSWLRESSVILLVIRCIHRNNGSHQFDQSSIAVIMHLDLLLLWTESAKKYIYINLARWKLINNFLQPVLRINWISCSWTLLHWDTEIFLHLMRLEGGASCTYLGVAKSLILGLNKSVGGKLLDLSK